MWLRFLQVPVGAFLGYNACWIAIGILTPGDNWANGHDTRVQLAVSTAAVAVLAFHLRPLVLKLLLLAAAVGCGYFRMTASPTWWAKPLAGPVGPPLSWNDAEAQVLVAAREAWQDREQAGGWDLRISPPLPEEWPPEAGGGGKPNTFATLALDAYAYATRRGEGGGEETTAPWGRISIFWNNPTVITDGAELHPLGVQRPAAVPDGHAAIAAIEASRRTAVLPEKPLLQTFYCAWIAANPLLAAHLAQQEIHAPFFAWLACPPR